MSLRELRHGWLGLFAAVFCAGASAQFASSPGAGLPPNPNDFVREMVKHELEAEANDHTHWRYRIHKESDGTAQDRDVIETSEGSLARTLLINGQPLTADQRSKDEERMRQLVADPSERAKRAKRSKQDTEKAQELLRSIPDAFIFKYDGTEGSLTRLTFTPNPNYDPPTRELMVYHAMAGKLWVDRAAMRLAAIEGQLTQEVKFGWGLFGHLDQGGTFKVVQKNVGENHWDQVSLDVNMQGRIVFFKNLSVKEKEELTDFRRMPDNLTIAHAYELLQQGSASASAGKETAAKLEHSGSANRH